MSTTIYLVRHGEVENPDGVEYMRLPGFHLSLLGKKQAKKVGQVLWAKGIDRIFASPLDRTKETAKIIADSRINIRYLSEFIEVNYKKWQGIKRDSRPKWELEGYLKDPVKFSAILGESLPDVQKRVVEKIIDIVEKHQGEKIVIVTHAVPMIVARLFFEARPLSDFQKIIVSFASVTTITLDNDLKLKEMRYNEYAKQIGKTEELGR